MSLLGMLSGVTSLVGGGSRARKQYHRQKKLMGFQRDHQMQLNQQGHDLQMDLWNKTNYKAQLEQMKKAGLNPALMYGSAGQGGSTAAGGGGGAAGGSAPVETSMDISSMLMARQLEKLKAEVDLDKERANTEVSKQEDISSIIKERDGVKKKDFEASIELKKYQKENYKLQNEYYSSEIYAKIELLGSQAAKNRQEFKLTEKQWKGLVDEALGNGLNALNNSELTSAKTRLTNAENAAVFEKLDQVWAQIELKSEELGLRKREVDYNEIRTMVEKEFRGLELNFAQKKMWVDNGTKLLVTFIQGGFGLIKEGMGKVKRK